MCREGPEDAANHPRLFDHSRQIGTRDFLARAQTQHSAVDPLLDQIVIKRRLVLQVDFGLAARDLIKRRFGDIEMTCVDQVRHLPEEEGQKQCADVGAVHIGVRHDDDLVIPQFRQIEFVTPDPGAQRRDERADLVGRQHPVEARPFDVQDLAPKRQHRLVLALASLLCRAAGRVTLDDEQFRQRRVLLLAVGQLARQAGDVHGGLAARQFPGLARRFTRQRGLDDLADDQPGFGGMLLEPLAQLFVHQVFDRGPHLGRNQLVLGLGRKLRIRHLDRQDAGQPFAGIVAGEVDLFLLRDPRGLRIGVDRAGQRAAKACKMGAAITLGNVVGKGQHSFVVAVVPPQRHFHPDAAAFADNVDRVGHRRGFRAVEVAHEFAHAAFVEQLGMQRLGGAFILQDDAHARVQEGKFPQPVFQCLELVVQIRERAFAGAFLAYRGKETHFCAAPPGGRSDFVHMHDTVAAFEPGAIFLVVPPHRQFQPVRQRVHD